MVMTVLGLFSGIGGFELGFSSAGYQIVGMCECERFCQSVLRRHFPGVPIFDDIRGLSGDAVASECGRVDVVTGGFPCQDISLAGNSAGLAGARSGLWHEMLRIITEVRPTWVVAENVAALRSRGMGEVLRGLAAIGYDAEWHCIPAAAVGAPHRRDRVWIIAHAADADIRRCEGERIGGLLDGEWLSFRSDADGCGTRGPGRSAPGGTGQHEPERTLRHPHRPILESGRFQRAALDAARFWGARAGICHLDDGVPETLDGCGGVGHGTGIASGSGSMVRGMRDAAGTQAVSRSAGGSGAVSPEAILQPGVHGEVSDPPDGRVVTTPPESEPVCSVGLRGVRRQVPVRGPSHGPESSEQRRVQPEDVVRFLSHVLALEAWEALVGDALSVSDLLVALAEIGFVSEALSALPQVWRSLSDEEREWVGLRIVSRSPWCRERPGVPRVSRGARHRKDRLRALGNAIVPQIAQIIAEAIRDRSVTR